ncbi:hypothetical protein FACI_IFERC00001G0682 [Ferroplasma acidarmanus Fer1]|uniref:Uncharacterized protein n=1 Tax=Ferroplasma acidarmanus Fer1 TaxID=333146 RepID=S0APH3_FERAC|nr:hypothetical protein FACI_IFERC00001G0682 [Ferroplasma acidarmanus Fer1]
MKIYPNIYDLGPSMPLAICPPSSCPAGIRFIAVANMPTHTAKTMGNMGTLEGSTIPNIW